ncbi:MAG: DUF502 domain-containing protein, partial [Candidatus Cyclobacteriaceae bacterium M2_1C_046]
VLVQIGSEDLQRIGFVTQKDLQSIGLDNMVAVYCPHSYNFSGNLYLVPQSHVTPLNLNSTDIMKFVVSAGVTKMEIKQ